jgi:hypothetical protein
VHNLGRFNIEVFIFKSLNCISEIDNKLLKFLTTEIHNIWVENNNNFFNSFFFFRLFSLIIGLSCLWRFFNLHFDNFAGLTLISWYVFCDKSRQSVLVVQLSHKGTRVTLAIYFIPVNSEVHFGELALGAANIFFNELIQYFSQIFLSELSVDDVVSVILSTCLFEGCLGGLFEAEPFQDILLVCSEMLCHITEIYDVCLDAITLGLDF